jgi:membrane protease subunit HflC
MNGKSYALFALLAIVIVLVVGVRASTYVIDERDQAVVTRLNRPIRVILGDMSEDKFQVLRQEIIEAARGATDVAQLEVDKGAGLYFKTPFIDTVNRFPDTLLYYEAEPEDIILADKKKLIVDNFARWRIENPLLYWIRLRDEVAARGALDDIIYSVVREELGKNDLVEVIRTTNRAVDIPATPTEEDAEVGGAVEERMTERVERGRETIMKTVAERAKEMARSQYGISVLDVRIKRADLLRDNLQMVFSRMTAERSRISKGYRSDGRKEADIIESETDRRVQVILANAKREASMLRGEGDAEVLRIYAEGFSRNPQLYRFMRSLEVLQESTPPGSELIIGLDSSLYKMLKSDQ